MFMRNSVREEKLKRDFNDFMKNIVYYGIGIPDNNEEIPVKGFTTTLPKVRVNTPMPEVKPPKIEFNKEDNTILNNYKNSIALNLLQHLEELEHITALSDKIEWCSKRANRIIELIFGEKEDKKE